MRKNGKADHYSNMTHINKAIEDAIDGGWRRKRAFEFNTWQDHLGDIFLDPLFWQALGKTRGWDIAKHENGYAQFSPAWEMENEEARSRWKKVWHSLLDHLATQRPISEFFENLK